MRLVRHKEASRCPLVIIILFALALSSPIYYTGLLRTTWATRGTCLFAIYLCLSPTFIIRLFPIFSASSVSSLCFRNDWLPTCFGQAQYKPVFFSLVPFRFNTLYLVYGVYSFRALISSTPCMPPSREYSPCILHLASHVHDVSMPIARVYSSNYKYSIFLRTEYDNFATHKTSSFIIRVYIFKSNLINEYAFAKNFRSGKRPGT